MKNTLSVLLCIVFIFVYSSTAYAVFDPTTTQVTEYGPILIHGQTLEDLWGNQSNHPPTDGSAKTWSYYPDGHQIVTKGDIYWVISPGQNSWVLGSLKSKWSTCSNFPTLGIDAYSIKPSTGDEYAHSGIYLFSLNSSGQCTINGQDWKTVWSTQATSPSGNYPLKDHDHIDQFQWLSDNLQIVITQNQMWILGSDTTSVCTTPGAPWHFCEPETLYDRWVVKEKKENHPPTDKIGLFAVSYNPYYQINTYDNYIWTLGQDNIWDTFRSGFDGYGTREPFFMKDNNRYYLYYDAMDINKNWTTAVAVADHPKGPWNKLGPIQFNGVPRQWEKGSSAASSVFHLENKYYNFYLGAPGYSGGDSNGNPYRVPGFNSQPSYEYYRLGLAVADNPLGPFRRLRGDGTLADSTFSDPPLLGSQTSGWHAGNFASAQGSLLNINGKYYYTTTSMDPRLVRFGVGISSADNILGPWQELPDALLPFSAISENSNIFWESNSGFYLMLSNAVYSPQEPRWISYLSGTDCDAGWGRGVGLVMYWSKDLFNWDWQNNYRILTGGSGDKSCNKDALNFIPGQALDHKGSVGLGSFVYVPQENRLYAAFDGNNFSTTGDTNHMFRNIYLLSIDVPIPPSPTPSSSPTPTPTPVPLPGDLNGDHVVNKSDYDLLIPYFGQSGSTGWVKADINNDGRVDIYDYNILVSNYGSPR